MTQERSFEYQGPPNLIALIERALGWVTHPLLGLNVLDAGLVYCVKADGQHVRVSIMMTTPGCKLTDLLVEDIEAELFDHLGGEPRVEVEIVRKPAWTSARMTVVPLRFSLPCTCARLTGGS